jgi:hypothetical protein
MYILTPSRQEMLSAQLALYFYQLGDWEGCSGWSFMFFFHLSLNINKFRVKGLMFWGLLFICSVAGLPLLFHSLRRSVSSCSGGIGLWCVRPAVTFPDVTPLLRLSQSKARVE